MGVRSARLPDGYHLWRGPPLVTSLPSPPSPPDTVAAAATGVQEAVRVDVSITPSQTLWSECEGPYYCASSVAVDGVIVARCASSSRIPETVRVGVSATPSQIQ